MRRIIEKDKPLPDHTKLDYDECCAKLILEERFPEIYGHIDISDMPDLQSDNGIGIEVTIANDEKMMRALSAWIKIPYADERHRNSYIRIMEKCGVPFQGGIQSWPITIVSFKKVREAIEKKQNKLNKGNYSSFQHLHLFVFTDTWFDDDIVGEAKNYLFAEHKNQISFERIYILSIGLFLHVFDLIEKEHFLVLINNAEGSERNVRAREMVEMAEIE